MMKEATRPSALTQEPEYQYENQYRRYDTTAEFIRCRTSQTTAQKIIHFYFPLL